MALITGSIEQADFADCDMVIEAVFEDMELKKSIFKRARRDLQAGRTACVEHLGARRQRDCCGDQPSGERDRHALLQPANVMKLLENVRGDKSSDSVVATTMAIGKKIKKVSVMVGVCPGFVGNRMLFMRGAEAERMMMEGATPAQIDSVLYDFGFPMGPFSMSDLAGLDIGWKEEKSSSSTIREILCENGRRGQKNGRGYYTYDPDTRAATPDPEVEQLIKDFAVRRAMSSVRSPIRRSSNACSTRWSTRARRFSRRRSRSAAATSMWCGSTVTAGRSTAVARCTGPTRSVSPRSCRRSRATASHSVASTGNSARCCSLSLGRAANCRLTRAEAAVYSPVAADARCLPQRAPAEGGGSFVRWSRPASIR